VHRLAGKPWAPSALGPMPRARLNGHDGPMTSVPRIAADFARAHRDGIRELAFAGVFVLAYFGIRNLTAGDPATAYANAGRIMRFERWAHLAWEASLQAPVVAHPALVTLVNWIYIWGHWPVIITIALLLFRYRRGQYLLLRNAVFVSGAIGFLFFALFPVAPPRLLVGTSLAVPDTEACPWT